MTTKDRMRSTQRSNVYNSRIAVSRHADSFATRPSHCPCVARRTLLSRVPAISASDWSGPEAHSRARLWRPRDRVRWLSTSPIALPFRAKSLTKSAVVCVSGWRHQGLCFVSADQAAATIKISLSEDLQNYVWIAEIHLGAGESSVVMTSTPRGASTLAGHDAAVTIHKPRPWSQPQRILDVAVVDCFPTHMAVLGRQSSLTLSPGERSLAAGAVAHHCPRASLASRFT